MMWRGPLLVFGFSFASVTFFLLSAGTVVMNGTESLPHNGYFMLRFPKIVTVGSYAAFDAPDRLREEFEGLSFVKRVVGVPGDSILASETEVCVNGYCRELDTAMLDRGFGSIQSGVVPDGQYVMFGDADNSLDSRYDVLGLVDHSDLVAVGVPLAMPHWKEVQAWFGG